jgi:hypothetical protein
MYQFYDLLQVIDEFVDREKLPVEQSDVVFESKIIVDKDSNVDAVMGIMEGKLKITYLSNKNGVAPAEGEAALKAMQDDLDDDEEDEDDEEEDEEVLEMVRWHSTIQDLVLHSFAEQFCEFKSTSICNVSSLSSHTVRGT